MPRKFEFATGGSGDGGAKEKKINVVYPPEVQRKLDDALGVVEKAGSASERTEALAKYKQLVDVVGPEQQERMKLVEFRGEKIHNFELQALQKIVEQINADYAEQRKVDPRFKRKDMGVEDVVITVKDGKVTLIDLNGRTLKKIPEAMGALINLQELVLSHNRITEISGLESLTNLQRLWLTGNQITEINGLERLINLHYLSLDNNRITKISGLRSLTKLSALWLDGNKIDQLVPANAAELERLKRFGVTIMI